MWGILCVVISVRNTCTISRLALDDTAPVSMALCTLPENMLLSGILKVMCQSEEGVQQSMDEDNGTAELQSYKVKGSNYDPHTKPLMEICNKAVI